MTAQPVIVAPAPAPLPVAAIAPPLDKPVRVTVTEIRGAGREVQRFVVIRSVLFQAEPDGFRATVTMLRADASATPGEQRMFAAANAGLLNRPIVLHLDPQGAVRTVDDEEAVWQAWLGGIGKIAAGTAPGREQSMAAVRSPLATLSPERRRTVIGSAVTMLIASVNERQPAGAHPVQLKGGVANGGVMLTGTATTTADGDAMRSELHATGVGGDGANVDLTLVKQVDPGSGLLRSSTQRTVTRTRNAGTLTRTLTTQID